jgi:hypothetical protein
VDQVKDILSSTWVMKLLTGTITRGVMWALAGLCGYLTAKGIQTPAADQSAVTQVVTAALAVLLPIVASLWSTKKDATLLATEPPKS